MVVLEEESKMELETRRMNIVDNNVNEGGLIHDGNGSIVELTGGPFISVGEVGEENMNPLEEHDTLVTNSNDLNVESSDSGTDSNSHIMGFKERLALWRNDPFLCCCKTTCGILLIMLTIVAIVLLTVGASKEKWIRKQN